jgi:cell division protein FtsN
MQNQKREVGQQMDLNIEARLESKPRSLKPNSLMANSTKNSPTLVNTNLPRHKIASAAAVAVLFLIIVATTRLDQPNASVPENFKRRDSSPATPIARHFPDTQFPVAGAKLQLGVFSKLQGAESLQTKLSNLGLLPHIEKRPSVKRNLYAVVLGPLDEETHQHTLKELKKNGLKYFHTEWLSEAYSTDSGL